MDTEDNNMSYFPFYTGYIKHAILVITELINKAYKARLYTQLPLPYVQCTQSKARHCVELGQPLGVADGDLINDSAKSYLRIMIILIILGVT